MANEADAQTLKMIQEVKKRKAEIAKIERPNYKTNCSFTFEEGSSKTVNIRVESSLQKLINIVAFLKDRKKSYDVVAKELEVESPPSFTWDGNTVNDWMNDIKKRIEKVQVGHKKDKLEKLETRLNAIVSPELRQKMELEAIAAELA